MKTLLILLNEYIERLESLNYSRTTRKTVYYNCLGFIRWIQRTHGVETTEAIVKVHLAGWQKHLKICRTEKGLPLKPRSINKKLENVKGYLNYLVEFGLIQKSTTMVLRYVKEPRMLPRGVLENSDMKRMLKNISTTDPIGFRDRTVLELMYSCGLRSGEVVNLNVNNIDFTHKLAKVRGKGNKERMVPVGKTAMEFLENYVKAVRPHMLLNKDDDALFINSSGTRMQYHTLRLLIKEHADNANLKEHITTHSFRRSCATELIRSGANLYHVKELLGHEDLQSLKHYTKLTINDLRKTHAKCHPRERES
jgi:site-specific recombinase XerD